MFLIASSNPYTINIPFFCDTINWHSRAPRDTHFHDN